MFLMELDSCTLLKKSVEVIRDVSMTINPNDELRLKIFLSAHGIIAVFIVNQPGKLMAVVICLNGPYKFEHFDWSEPGYRTAIFYLDDFISMFELEAPHAELLSVFDSLEDPENSVSFFFVPSDNSDPRNIDINTTIKLGEPPQVDEPSGLTLTMTPTCLKRVLDYFGITEEGQVVEDFLWIQKFPEFLRFNVGDKEFELADVGDQYRCSHLEVGQIVAIHLGHAHSFLKAIEISEEVAIIASNDHTLLKCSTTQKGPDVIFFIEGIPMEM